MRIYLTLAALAASVFVGCNHSPEGGSPGTASTFTLSAPTLSTTIKQDNKESVKLTVGRGSDFKKAISFDVKAPDKIKAELSKTTLAPSDPGELMLNITVAKDAPLGDQTIHVTGTPEGGGTATAVDVKIKVEKNP